MTETRRSRKVPCPNCGAPIGPKSEPCVECHALKVAIEGSLRDRELERLWAMGLTVREIGIVLGISLGAASYQITSARLYRNADLPYRAAPPPKREPPAPVTDPVGDPSTWADAVRG